MTPLDYPCPHIDSHGFRCGAEVGDPCVNIDRKGNWSDVRGFHEERLVLYSPAVTVPSLSLLSPAERRVFRHIVDGHNRESICTQCDIKMETLRRHVNSINRKLYTNSQNDIICWYLATYCEPKKV